MNMQLIKKRFRLILILLISLPAISWQTATDVPVAGSHREKPIIDTSIIPKWPTLGFVPPSITKNGDYAAYIISNKSASNNTLNVISTRNSWKKEIHVNSIPKYFFSIDGKKLYWTVSDTLFSLSLGQNRVDYLAHIKSLQTPRLKKGEWIAYQFQDETKELIVRNLISDRELRVNNVMDYVFNNSGTALVANTRKILDSSVTTTLHWFDLLNCSVTVIWTGKDQITTNYSFDKLGNQLAFTVMEQNNNPYNNSIWYYRKGSAHAVLKLDGHTSRLVDSSFYVEGAATFSENGKWLFFHLQKEEKRSQYPDPIKVDIWSYKDKVLYPQQSAIGPDELQAVISVDTNTDIYIGMKDEQLMVDPVTVTGDYIVVSDRRNVPQWWPHLPPRSYWIINLKDGSRALLKKDGKAPAWDFSFSPTGRWLIYWDSEKAAFMSYDTEKKKSFNITSSVPLVSRDPDYIQSFYNSTYSQPEEKPAGWYVGEDALLIYNQYDIWKIDPSGQKQPANITNNYGTRYHTKLRLVYDKDSLNQPVIYSGKESVLLTAFNKHNKYNGFLIKDSLDEKKDPALLTMGPYTYYIVESQKAKFYTFGDGIRPVKGGEGTDRIWITQRSSATEAPNYFVSNDLIRYKPITNLQPQKQYNWLTAELVTWKQLDGSRIQGILYKPENFDPQKKYPVIFNYYEMLSHRIYGFPSPWLTEANIDISWFVSRGYLVFTPDIHFSTANSKTGKTPGEAAYNSIESAALFLSKLPYVNSHKMAIQGHSFGGGITNDLITRSNLFAAACSVAGTVSDEVSAYLGLARANGAPPREYRMDHAETGHDRIGASLWERPDLYIRASPVFRANRVTTPLLIMHNQSDGACDWGQSAELYMALRRLGKKVWMLQYDNEGHELSDGKNAMDFTIRLTQFFDHYLKDAAPPLWMTDGIPARSRGLTNGYELDTSGRKP